MPDDPTPDQIAERLSDVRARIEAAAVRAGRAPGSVRLVAVSKTKPVALLRAAYAAGQRLFGENYAQELAEKAEALADLPDLEWHFIGHLQRNKAKQVGPVARAVHTVDSRALAAELGKRASGRPATLRVLIEVNVSGEASKSGCSPDEAAGVLAAIRAEPALEAAGLMTIPPLTEDPEAARPYFAALRALRDRLRGALGDTDALPELSMGMTHDFDVAIAEGATLVRVGTAIFGARG
jgi:pyridoxal phosphate enzyme (YggS family)